MNRKLIIILGLALVLRLITLNQSFWLDEAIGAITVRNLSFHDVLINFPKGDNHPPLYYAMLDVWGQMFGYSEVGLRSLSVIFGAATVLFTYKIALLLWRNKNTALIAALLIATSQFHVYYSQEARMYVVAGFFASTAVYYFLKFIEKNLLLDLVLFSVSITASVFSDYVPVLLLPIFPIYILIHKRKLFLKTVLSYLPIVFLGVLWFPIFVIQSTGGAAFLQALPAWKEIAGGATPKQALLVWTKFTLGRISFDDKSFYYTLLTLVSLPFIGAFVTTWTKKLSKEEKLIWMWLLFPLIVGFVASFIFPLFNYFRFVFVVPAFYLLIAKAKKRYLSFVLVINLMSLGAYYFLPMEQREDWRGAMNMIENNISETEIVLFTNPEPFAPFRFYNDQNINAIGVLDSVKIDPIRAAEETKLLTEDKNGVYYFRYLSDLMDPTGIVKATIEENFTVKEVYNFSGGLGQVYYYRK